MIKSINNVNIPLPDFIIVGAMKSGTTSLHNILSHHENIFIPKREIMFFDIDDIVQNLDFFVQVSRKWNIFDFDKRLDEYLKWYSLFFNDANDNQIIGEDSTTYMASQNAPKRIAQLLPDVKLIFMLRDPVKRSYSNYWHLVHSGNAMYDFEKTIQFMPGTILQRSLYKSQIERFKRCFKEKYLYYIVFEEFIVNTQKRIDEVCKFLGLSSSLDIRKLDTHKNPTKVPKNIKLQIWFNHIFRSHHLVCKRFASHLANVPKEKSNLMIRKIDKIMYRFNFSEKKSYPPMNRKTEKFLEKLFAKENRGISKSIGIEVKKYWPYMDE